MQPIDLSRYSQEESEAIMQRMKAMPADMAIEQVAGEMNPFFPYERLHEFQDLSGAERLPQRIVTYLLDLPRPGIYTPPESNEFPRARFWRYLYYDDNNPLIDNPLPTAHQKKSVHFKNSEIPPDKEKGYRLFAQPSINQSQGQRQNTVKVYTGRKIPIDSHATMIALVFEIFVSSNKEWLEGGIARTEGIEQALIESLSGVYLGGLGSIVYNRQAHPDCGTRAGLTDSSGVNIGRIVTMAVEWKTGLSGANYGSD